MKALRAISQSLHDAWCVITGKCDISASMDDPDFEEKIGYLKRQEQDANTSVAERRRKRDNMLEDIYLHNRLNAEKRRQRGET